MSKADFSKTDLSIAYLRNKLQGLTQVRKSWLDSQSKELASNLKEVNLSKALLIKANFSDANLNGANLSGASLHKAILTNAHLYGADLTGAKLEKTILKGAKYNTETIKITCPEQHEHSILKTQWPEGFDPGGTPDNKGQECDQDQCVLIVIAKYIEKKPPDDHHLPES